MKLRLLFILAVLVVATGCDVREQSIDRLCDKRQPGLIDDLTHLGKVGWPDVYRFIDRDAGVACWMSTESRGSGISCLPLSETSLDE